MNICIYGAGAIGSFIGCLLARQGHKTTLIGRGPHLQAMRKKGVRLEMGGEVIPAYPDCREDPDGLCEQDAVIISVKAPALGAVIPRVAPMLGPHTAVVTAMNGIPWWFFQGLPKALSDPLQCVDPDGTLGASIPDRAIVGCVIHFGATVVEPGLVRHAADNRLILGAPDGRDSDRCNALAGALLAAGFNAVVTKEIQQEIWLKLLGNFNFGPLSVLTDATNGEIATDPALRQTCLDTGEEAVRVGEAYGLLPGMTIAERIDLGGTLGDFRTSMWHDYQRGRPMEIDAIVGAVVEMARRAGVATPGIDVMHNLLVAKARLKGLY